jgi:hypothetical protein
MNNRFSITLWDNGIYFSDGHYFLHKDKSNAAIAEIYMVENSIKVIPIISDLFLEFLFPLPLCRFTYVMKMTSQVLPLDLHNIVRGMLSPYDEIKEFVSTTAYYYPMNFNDTFYADPLKEMPMPASIFKILVDQGYTDRLQQLQILSKIFSPLIFPEKVNKQHIVGLVGVAQSGKSVILETLLSFEKPKNIYGIGNSIQRKHLPSYSVYASGDLKPSGFDTLKNFPKDIPFIFATNDERVKNIKREDIFWLNFPNMAIIENWVKIHAKSSLGSIIRLLSYDISHLEQ